MPSQWPPSAHSVLKVVGAIAGAAFVSMTSWLLMSHISSQVLQAQNAQAIETVQAAVKGNAAKHDDAEARGRKLDEVVHGINLTAQRLADMIARHESDIDEIKSDMKSDRRRRRRGE